MSSFPEALEEYSQPLDRADPQSLGRSSTPSPEQSQLRKKRQRKIPNDLAESIAWSPSESSDCEDEEDDDWNRSRKRAISSRRSLRGTKKHKSGDEQINLDQRPKRTAKEKAAESIKEICEDDDYVDNSGEKIPEEDIVKQVKQWAAKGASELSENETEMDEEEAGAQPTSAEASNENTHDQSSISGNASPLHEPPNAAVPNLVRSLHPAASSNHGAGSLAGNASSCLKDPDCGVEAQTEGIEASEANHDTSERKSTSTVISLKPTVDATGCDVKVPLLKPEAKQSIPIRPAENPTEVKTEVQLLVPKPEVKESSPFWPVENPTQAKSEVVVVNDNDDAPDDLQLEQPCEDAAQTLQKFGTKLTKSYWIQKAKEMAKQIDTNNCEFQRQNQMCREEQVKGQLCCLLHFLQIASTKGYILPSRFNYGDNLSFFGWTGFEVTSDRFKQQFDSMFGPDGRPSPHAAYQLWSRSGLCASIRSAYDQWSVGARYSFSQTYLYKKGLGKGPENTAHESRAGILSKQPFMANQPTAAQDLVQGCPALGVLPAQPFQSTHMKTAELETTTASSVHTDWFQTTSTSAAQMLQSFTAARPFMHEPPNIVSPQTHTGIGQSVAQRCDESTSSASVNQSWSTQQVCQKLKEIGLEMHVEKFKECAIDSGLFDMLDQFWEDLGVTLFPHKVKIKRAFGLHA